jgi:hypothetical protein
MTCLLVDRNGTQQRLDEERNAQLMQEFPPEEMASREEDPGDSETVDDRPIDAFVQLAKTAR